MEAVWKLEDKWNLSTQAAVLLFVCTASLLVTLCAATVLMRRASSRNKSLVDQEPSADLAAAEPAEGKWSPEPRVGCGWGSVKKLLMGSVRWSRASKWEESVSVIFSGRRRMRREKAAPLLGREVWPSHNSVSPVWQRPILMGEKCELPRFSGLILYDERGRPLHQSEEEPNTYDQILGKNKPENQINRIKIESNTFIIFVGCAGTYVDQNYSAGFTIATISPLAVFFPGAGKEIHSGVACSFSF